MSWLLENKITRNSLAVLYGTPKVGKSFLALRWALELAHAGNHVIYLAGEGVGGIGSRIRSWYQHTGEQQGDIPLYFPATTPNVLDMGAVLTFLEGLRSEEGLVKSVEDGLLFGRVDMLVVDTLARMMVGADENDAGDVSLAIHNLDYLRQETGAAVLVLHHTTKASPLIERGSTALRGAADVMLRLGKSDGLLKLSVDAARDFESGQEHFLEPKKVGESLVLCDYAGTVVKSGDNATKLQGLVLQCIRAGACSPVQLVEQTGKPRRTIENAIDGLLAKGLIQRSERGIYHAVADAGT